MLDKLQFDYFSFVYDRTYKAYYTFFNEERNGNDMEDRIYIDYPYHLYNLLFFITFHLTIKGIFHNYIGVVCIINDN